MIENIKEIEERFQLPEGTLKSAIESAEPVKVELPELEIFKKEDYNSRIENLKSTFQKQGQDFLIKEQKEKLGLDFEGKDFNKFTEAFQSKILKDAKIEPDEKYKSLKSDFEKVQQNLLAKDQEIENIRLEFGKKDQYRTFKETVLSKIPNETAIPKDDIFTIFSSRYDKTDEGFISKATNELLKNKTTLNPLGIEEILNDFITPYIKTPEGGKGGKDEFKGGKAGSLEAFQQEMEAREIKAGSSEFNQEMSNRIANKTLTF